ncbi:MAG: 4-(cytidine 5'-diphospho)-2-C-methyl-D-erythritol kinase [Candidatus Gastranaerophilales bacterium]|nr:4-(cytidine 5'-diphospho)-2-C-methyl-D-erythritol kinase [Candidatus Gastranaerophilales bacterium]
MSRGPRILENQGEGYPNIHALFTPHPEIPALVPRAEFHPSPPRGEGEQTLIANSVKQLQNIKEIKVKCPAKINLTLEVLDKRPDGFHNIQSVMQTINLFDILTIKIEESEDFEIKLSGTSNEIPYDERNLAYKAAELFFRCKDAKMQRCKEKQELCIYASMRLCIFLHIEKNIPVAAGLAGGSTDAAGTLWGLNKLFDNILSDEELHQLCLQLGSDLNFCLEGGCQLATSRGEILEKLPFQEFRLSLIKPKNLGISAKEAYTKFSAFEKKPNLNMTTKLINAVGLESPTYSHEKNIVNIQEFLHNDLEAALIEEYQELREIKMEYPEAIMSGSGSTFFAIDIDFKDFNDNFWIKNGLKSIPYGVCEFK